MSERPESDAVACAFCDAEAEQGMAHGDVIVWTCMGHEDDGSPVDHVMQARRRYNRSVGDHYDNLHGKEEWWGVPQSVTYERIRSLGAAFEQAIRAEAVKPWREAFMAAWVALQDVDIALVGVEADMDDEDYREARTMLSVAQSDLGRAMRDIEEEYPGVLLDRGSEGP